MAFLGLLLFILVIFIQPQEFVPIIQGTRIVNAIGIFTIVSWLLMILKNKKRNNLFKFQHNKLMLLLWVVIIISTIKVNWISYSIDTSIEWGKIVLIYLILVSVIDTNKKMAVIIWSMVLSSLFLSITGIMQKNGIDITGLGLREEGRIRGIGIFDTNQLAYTLAFICPFVMGLFVIHKNIILRGLLLLIISCDYYAIYLTGSRGGMLCSIFILLLMFLIVSKKGTTRVFGVIICIIVGILFLQFSSRLQSVSGYQSDESALGRLNVWGEALSSLKNNFVFGVGKDQFQEYHHLAPHNSYIQVVSELGFVGLFLWLSLFYFSIKNMNIIANRMKLIEDIEYKIFAQAFIISMFAYLFGSFFSGSAYYITLYIMFGLLVALQGLVQGPGFDNFKKISFNDMLNVGIAEIIIIFVIHCVS